MPESPTLGLSLWAPYLALWAIIVNGGWLALAAAFFYGFGKWYMTTIQLFYDHKIDHVLLAVDVPRENEQSPKAVEHIFSQLHGIKKSGNIIERFFEGYDQIGFSLELISIDGYIQYLIRTPKRYRDLVEAAIYAQYPDAEISEAEDYTKSIPYQFPDDEYNIWGTELQLENEDVYPIRTYPEFEHSLSQEYKDPMAGLLEMLSRLQAGEQYWIQILITPTGIEWRERGKRIIKKLIGARAVNGKAGIIAQVSQGVSESLTASLIPSGEMAEKKEENRWPTLMQHLSPDERSIVEAVGIKLSKIGFKTKIRLVYVARKEIYDVRTRQQAIIGALKQFYSQDLNGFKEDKKSRTRVVYPPLKSVLDWRLKRRQYRIMRGYKGRSQVRGRNNFVLNIEELASLWHFPVLTVKAPLVQKTESKRSEPPTALPLEGATGPTIAPSKPATVAAPAPSLSERTPTNLPIAG